MNTLNYQNSYQNNTTSHLEDEVIYDVDTSLQTLKGQLLFFVSQQFATLSSLYSKPGYRKILQDLLSKINGLRRAIITVDTHKNREGFEYIREILATSEYREFIKESVIEINKELAKLYYFTGHDPQAFIELGDIFRKIEEKTTPSTNVISIESEREKRRRAVEGLMQSESNMSGIAGIASISSIRQARTKIANTLGTSGGQLIAAEILTMDMENQIGYNHVQPDVINDSIINSIRRRTLEDKDYNLLGGMQHYLETKAANDPNFNQNGLSLSHHIRDFGPDKNIIVDTTYGEMRITKLVPFFPIQDSTKQYYKADIEFQGKKLKVLVRDDMFRVGSMADLFLGFFDKNGKLIAGAKGASGYIIKSIRTVIQKETKEKSWSEKVSSGLGKLRSWFGKF